MGSVSFGKMEGTTAHREDDRVQEIFRAEQAIGEIRAVVVGVGWASCRSAQRYRVDEYVVSFFSGNANERSFYVGDYASPRAALAAAQAWAREEVASWAQ